MSKNEVVKQMKKETIDVVEDKVKQFQDQGDLHFPANYSPQNALKSAWLMLQSTVDKNKKPALEVCTRDSIANALLSMVVQGLNPYKNQGYFIVYGNQLVFHRSYFGTMAVTKRVTGAKSIDASVIYEGDKVDYEMKNGRIINLTHKQKFENIDKEYIIGAYCIIDLGEDNLYTEVMTIEEIRKAWSKSQMWGKDQTKERKGSTHEEFRQEMAKKTVINRACKKLLNSSDDRSLVIDHFNQQDEVIEEAQARKEISENANSEVIDMDSKEEPKQEKETNPKQPEGDLKQAAPNFEEEKQEGGVPF